MDYKKYYLKNLISNDDKNKTKFCKQNYCEDEKKQSTSLIQPKIIYLQPISNSAQEAKQDYDYDAVPINEFKTQHNKPPTAKQLNSENKIGTKIKRTVAFVIIVIMGIMASFIASDYITDGMVFSSLTAKTQKNNCDYYVVVLKQFGTYQDAQNCAMDLRLQGAAGYILKEQEKYCVIGEVFDNQEDANKVSEKQTDSQVLLLKLPTIDYKNLPKPYDKKLEGYLDYAQITIDELSNIIPQLISIQMSEQEAISRLYAQKTRLLNRYEEFKIFSKENNAAFANEILSDIQIDISLLDNLCNQELERPNLVCDIRYYKMQMLINFQQMCYSIK